MEPAPAAADGCLFMAQGFDAAAQAAFDVDADRAADEAHGMEDDECGDDGGRERDDDRDGEEDDGEEDDEEEDGPEDDLENDGGKARSRKRKAARGPAKAAKKTKALTAAAAGDNADVNGEMLRAAVEAGERAADAAATWFKEHITEENLEAFERCWTRTEKAINEVIESTMRDSFDGICAFLESATQAEYMRLGALCTGLDVGDHQITCAKLCATLRERISPRLALVGPDDCTSVQAGIEAIVSKLSSTMDETSSKGPEDEDKDAMDAGQTATPARVLRAGAGKRVRNSTLVQRIEKSARHPHQRRGAATGRKRALRTLPELEAAVESNSNAQQVVTLVVLDDAENIDVGVLRSIIRILLAYHEDPSRRVFRFGVVLGLRSSSFQGVHGLLSRAETARTQIMRFKIEQGRALLDKITDDILMSDRVPLRLGPRVLDRLSQVFLQEEYSFRSFLRSLKLLTIVHFTKTRCAYLSCRRDGEGAPLLTSKDCDYLLSLPSASREAQRAKGMNDLAKHGLVTQLIADQETNRKDYPEAFKRLYESNRILQPHLHSAFRGSLRAAYVELLSDPRATCRDLRARMDKCSLDTLQSLLATWGLPDAEAEFARRRVADQEADTAATAASSSTSASPNVGALRGEALRAASMKKNKRMELLQAGMSAEERAAQRSSSSARKFALQKWEETVEAVVCRSGRPLDEIFSLQSAKSLNKLIAPSHRDIILTTLAKPRIGHDTSTAYQILRGHGRRKQLGMLEWYEEFCAACDAEDDITQRARFMQASTELRFLGICKPSSRASANVVKLVFD